MFKKDCIEEAKVWFYKTKADFYRYLAESLVDDAKAAAVENARKAYNDAFHTASASLPVTHPIRLCLALNLAKFQYEVLGNSGEACNIAYTAFNDACMHLFHLMIGCTAFDEESYKVCKLIMQRLLDKRSLWLSNSEVELTVTSPMVDSKCHQAIIYGGTW